MKTSRRRFLAWTGGAVGGLVLAQPRFILGSRAVQAQAIPGAPSFRGAAGQSVVGPVSLNAGIAVLRAQHNGTGNFGITTFVPNDGYSPQDAINQAQVADSSLVYDVIGAYKGGSVVQTTLNADHYISVNASGAWQISLEQPLPENVAATQGTNFSGKGQDITPYFTLPDGVTQITMDAPSTSALTGSLFHLDDLGGEAIQAGIMGHYGEIFEFNNPANQPGVLFTPPDAGPYIFFVTNDVRDTTPWMVSFA